jgi:AraC family transcriptional regulator
VKHETRSFYEVAVRAAVAQVVAQLDQALDLERLARAAALSPFHFHRIFRGMVGETPLELHRRLRMERAAQQLLDSGAAVTTIALNAGYDSHEAFTRAFRGFYGCSPSEFRQRGASQGMACMRPPQLEIAARSSIHFRSQTSAEQVLQFIQGAPNMDVEVKQMPALRVAAVHHVGPYNRISEAFGRLGDIAGRAGLLDGKPTMLALYYDDPEVTPEAELNSDAAIVVSENAQLAPGLAEHRLPAGRYACTVHIGPYEQLGDTWSRFMGQWLPQSGERMAEGTSYEIYVNNPTEVPQAQLRTELYIPLTVMSSIEKD